MVVLAAASVLAAPDWTDCPAACRCKWTSGKKTALCREAGLSALPATLNSDMQVLDVSDNSIPYLGKDAFRNVGLINLQRIFIRGSRLRDVHRDAFRDLIILIEVDLAYNEVSSLHPETFTGNDRLRVLYLSGNPLGELREAQFPSLPHLRTLELESCQLTHVHRDAFVHLPALESLNLRSNQLRQLSEAVFMSTGRLNTLALDGNPWRCDCQLRGFRNWYLLSNLQTGVPLSCSEPAEVEGKTWSSVPSSEFACAPAVTLTGNLVRADQGGNVSFGCHVRGDPEPEVTWLFNGRVIGSGNATAPDQVLVIEVEEGLLEKWTNISVFNVSDADAGEYSCVARNSMGAVAKNVTLVLPEVVTATTVSKADPWVLWLGVAGGGAAAALVGLGGAVAVCCACGHNRRRRKRHRRKGQIKGSVSFSDQEKKLLDVSITTTDRDTTCGGSQSGMGRGSCEMLQADIEMMEQSPSIELCDPPVHITIESHQPSGGYQSRSTGVEVADQAGALPVTVFPPPPPEFSTSVLPAGAFGNIFISVSVSQDPNALDVAARYPDLLDVTRSGGREAACSHLATLPRRPCRQVVPVPVPVVPVHYDNMGPRVTAGGSSTLSLPDAVGPPEDAIPPPPPPPVCTPHTGEYVSL